MLIVLTSLLKGNINYDFNYSKSYKLSTYHVVQSSVRYQLFIIAFACQFCYNAACSLYDYVASEPLYSL